MTSAVLRRSGGRSAVPRGNGKSRRRAFRTISEVAEELEVPQHVLRFWESKFPQVKPLKRGGGRRYYRPEDVELLRRIRQCLYDQGYTINGVQKLLREGALRGDEPAAPPADEEAPSTLFALEPVADLPEPASSPCPLGKCCARRSRRCGASCWKYGHYLANSRRPDPAGYDIVAMFPIGGARRLRVATSHRMSPHIGVMQGPIGIGFSRAHYL